MIKCIFQISDSESNGSILSQTFPREQQPTKQKKSPDELLDDLLLVGRTKLMGYLPQNTIINICGSDVAELKEALEQEGKTTLLLSEEQCRVASGALYAYDAFQLQKFLDQEPQKKILSAENWPSNVHEFVKRCIVETASFDTQVALYDLIALAYNDPRPFYQSFKQQDHGPSPYAFE